MRVCPCCGYADNPLWMQDRFVREMMTMRVEDFQKEYPLIYAKLIKAKKDVREGNFLYRITKFSKSVKRLEIYGYPEDAEIPFYPRYEGNSGSWSAKSMNREVAKINAVRSKKQKKIENFLASYGGKPSLDDKETTI